MSNGRTAKLRRRQVALKNIKQQLQTWKSASSDEEITNLLSTKVMGRFDGQPTSEDLKALRKQKIARAEHEIHILEKRV